MDLRLHIFGASFGLLPLALSITAAIFIPVLIYFLTAQRSRAVSSLPTLILAGPRDTGKTSFLTYLRDGRENITQTSTISSSATLQREVLLNEQNQRDVEDEDDVSGFGPSFRLLDTPGHPKLRSITFDYLSDNGKSLSGLIFMLDAAVLSSQTRLVDTAEYLYDVLLSLQQKYSTLSSLSTGSLDHIRVLIACNKSDLFTSLPPSKVSSLLQVELGRLKESKRKGMLNAGVDEDDNPEGDDKILGDSTTDRVSWDDLKEFGLDIAVQGGSIKSHKIGTWKLWIISSLQST